MDIGAWKAIVHEVAKSRTRLSDFKEFSIQREISEAPYQCISSVQFSSVQLLSHVCLFATPWTLAFDAPLSMGFSWQYTGVDCHFLLQGIFPTQGLNSGLSHCRQTLYHLSHQGSPS